jgi:hypothetical protein
VRRRFPAGALPGSGAYDLIEGERGLAATPSAAAPRDARTDVTDFTGPYDP